MQNHMVCIVGAPRCGTTSVSRYLRDHPSVTFSLVKEPHFFSKHDLAHISDSALRRLIEAEYLGRYFPHAPDEAECLAEGSVSYLYTPERMEAILRLWPHAKFIILLRDPMEMLPSLHQRLLYTGDEDQVDFSRAWMLCGERRHGRHVPRSCIDSRFLLYDELGRIGTHALRFMETVGRERCFLALYDDLAARPGRLYRQILDFLDLPDDGRREFAARRVSRAYKIGWLQRLLKRPPKAARMLLAGEKFRKRIEHVAGDRQPSAVTRLVWDARKRLLRWNSQPAPPLLLPQTLRSSIQASLAEEVGLLSQLVGRDLGHWLNSGEEHLAGGLKETSAFRRAA